MSEGLSASISDQNTSVTENDLIVIGAGVAGPMVAGLCAQKGWQTLLVEKESWPRTKVCGCCLNQRGWSVLERNGIVDWIPAQQAIPLTRMKLWGRTTRAQFPLPAGRVISRTILDGALVDWAKSHGARFLSETLARPAPNSPPDRVLVTLENRLQKTVVSTGLVVGAWGLHGQAVKWDADLTTEIQPGSRMGAGTNLPRETNCDLPLGTLLMVVGGGGYVGVVRLADESLDVAAAFDTQLVRQKGGPGQVAHDLLQKLAPQLARACQEAPWKGTPPLTRKVSSMAKGRVFLVGDAVGYVEPFTGEGMTWGLIGGEALGKPMSEVSMRSISAQGLDDLKRGWETLYQKRIAARQGICRGLSKALRWPLATEWGIGLIGFMPGVARRVASWLARE